jgi:uncharacterized protein
MEAIYSQNLSDTPPAVEVTPVPADQRIPALDVVRGFALLGIFLMNIEWFSRPIGTMDQGMPRNLDTINWLASYFVSYFVQGKFWTIFSLLFGMGFAIMLVRAERAGRDFVALYLRRILALAVFGAVHYIYLWPGDILFSYAVAAGALLIVLYGRAKYILISFAALIGLGFIPHCSNFFRIAGGLAFISLVALYLRNERGVRVLGRPVPIASLALLVIGSLASIAAIVFWLLPNAPEDPRVPLSVAGPVCLILGLLSVKYHEPKEKRSVRTAVTLFMLMGTLMTIFGAVGYFTPPDQPAPTVNAVAPTVNAVPLAVSAATKPHKTKEKRAAERKAERDRSVAEQAEKTREEVRLLTTGSYYDVTIWHASDFIDKATGDANFAGILIGMFLLGMWFVRSGVMENTAAHLDLFCKLVYIGLPVGLGLSVIASIIARTHVPGDTHDAFLLALGIKTLGDLPTCLGYVGMVVLMLHSKGPFSNIKILAPVGRMALTNYLTESLICALYFYGYGFGHWGMPRGQQVLFVLIVYSLQIAFSHWWLARFRYGPMEWLWRGFTYGRLPRLRVDAGPDPALRAI